MTDDCTTAAGREYGPILKTVIEANLAQRMGITSVPHERSDSIQWFESLNVRRPEAVVREVGSSASASLGVLLVSDGAMGVGRLSNALEKVSIGLIEMKAAFVKKTDCSVVPLAGSPRAYILFYLVVYT